MAPYTDNELRRLLQSMKHDSRESFPPSANEPNPFIALLVVIGLVVAGFSLVAFVIGAMIWIVRQIAGI